MGAQQPSKSWVFYADDDPEDLRYVSDWFSEHGEEVSLVTFPDAQSLLNTIRSKKTENEPCLVILDINMPGINGKQALQLLRSMRPYQDLPVVLFSTSSMPEDRHFARRYGAELIPKPLEEKEMRLIVDDFLQRCTDAGKGG